MRTPARDPAAQHREREAEAPELTLAAPPEVVLALQRTAGNAAVTRMLQRDDLEPADIAAHLAGLGLGAMAGAAGGALAGFGAGIGALIGAGAAAGAAAAVAEPTVTFGAHANQSKMTPAALQVLKDVLKAAGLKSAVVTSTARTPEDQARAMYANLVGSGKGQGVEAQHALYGAAGDLVIDEFVALQKAGKSADEIKQGMADKMRAIGPSKVSRHISDFSKLVVFDVGPNSITDHKAFVAAAQAEVGKRMSNFIPYPEDPGFHFEVPVK